MASATGATPATTSYGYGAGGVLESVSVADGRARTVSFVNDTNGQALRRDEADANYSQGDPHEVWYRFAGREIGHLGNNAAGASDYATSVAQREVAAGTGPFGNGDVSYGSDFATEDPGAITSFVQGAAGGSYTVRAGDTLASIAQALWGDASLWYKLAQANTLTADAPLSAGQVLTVPLGVQRSGYSAATFKPYDALDVLGDVSPVNPAPVAQAQGGHKHGCGVFGQILLTVVAVAVVVLSHGALTAALGGSSVLGGAAAGVAGSIVSQGVGLATGIQDRFSFSGVALAAIGGGVGGALTKVSAFGDASGIAKFGSDVVRGALGSAIGQGIGIATGLQSSFSWASVAAAGLGAGVGGAVGRALHVEPFATERSVGNIAATAATGAANALANAAAHTLIDGSDFGDNIMAALPDVIGSTVGELVAGAVSGGSARVHLRRETERLAVLPEFAGQDPSYIAAAAGFVTRGNRTVNDLAGDPEALSSLSDVADLLTSGNPNRYTGSEREQIVGNALSRVIGASDDEVDEALATYRQFGVTADVTRPALTGDLGGATLGDVVETGSYENGFVFGSLGDPALIGAGAAARYIGAEINDHPALRYALIGLDVATGPVAFAARQALAASPVGQAIEERVHQASDYIAGQYAQYHYGDLDARNAGVGAVTLAALAVGGATGALGSLGRLPEGEALTGTALARRLGLEGEQAVGMTGPKVGVRIPGTNQMRFPDAIDLDARTLTEVKNVAYQGYTRQLRDYAAYANDKGLAFELHVRGPLHPQGQTVLSSPLEQLVKAGKLKLNFIPGTF